MTTSLNSESRPKISSGQVIGISLGNALEFYDFLTFSFFAVQIGRCFFPNSDPTISLLSALATFGAGFLTRPFGAVIIGGMADRVGRRPMLLLSFALAGISTLGIALTPSYASIGVTAPIIVVTCRLLQGFALGGESGASTALLAEAAPPLRRGLYISLQHVSSFLATLVAGTIGAALALTMDAGSLAEWGWRIVIAIGVLIVPLGLVLRRSLPETLEPHIAAQSAPLFASYRHMALLALPMLVSGTIGTYVLIFMTTYAQTTLGLSTTIALGATIVVGCAGILAALAAGILSDRFGRRPLMIWPTVTSVVVIVPGFWLIVHATSTAGFYVVLFLLRLITQIGATTALINVTEGFPARVRSGGLATTYALATSVFGGTTQFVIAWLILASGDRLAPAWYMCVAAVIGLVAMFFARETAPSKRSDPDSVTLEGGAK